MQSLLKRTLFCLTTCALCTIFLFHDGIPFLGIPFSTVIKADASIGAAVQQNVGVAAPTLTPLPTRTPKATRTPLPTRTVTPTRTPTFTRTPLPTRTPKPTRTATPTPTLTPLPTAMATITPLPTVTATFTPLPTATATNTSTATPTATFTPLPSETPTSTPTLTETSTPTQIPTETPTITPTATPTPIPLLDWGDLPEGDPAAPTYGTTWGNNGAVHQLRAGLYIGNGVDPEPNGQPSFDATGDDSNGSADEDGVTKVDLILVGGVNAVIHITATNQTTSTATLYGWIDFDRNGLFDPKEGAQATVPATSLNQPFALSFSVPVSLTNAPLYARFRLSSDSAAASPTGYAADGEVEDYILGVAQWSYWKLQLDAKTNIVGTMVVTWTVAVGYDDRNGQPKELNKKVVNVTAQCVPVGAVTLTGQWADFAGTGYIPCSLPSYTDVMREVAPNVGAIPPRATCKDPYIALSGQLRATSTLSNPLIYSSNGDVEFFLPTNTTMGIPTAHSELYLNRWSAAPKTYISPLWVANAPLAGWWGYPAVRFVNRSSFTAPWYDFLNASDFVPNAKGTLPTDFLAWTNTAPTIPIGGVGLSTPVTWQAWQGDFVMDTGPIMLYIGYHPGPPAQYFDGVIEKLEFDPACGCVNGKFNGK